MADSATTKNETKKKANFFKGLKKEFRKVTWTDKTETAKQTTAVVVVSVAVGLIIALLDTLIQYGVDFLTTF